MSFNQRLKQARESKGLTQAQVANAIGVAKSTYSGYETGNSEPSMNVIASLMILLEVSPDFLWQDEIELKQEIERPEQEIRKQLAGKLRLFRQRAGLTAKEVGDKIGKSDKTVSGWEHGRGQPDADMLFLLCKIYGIENISEFYTNVAEQSASPVLQDEEELLTIYRNLNEEARATLLATARAFASNPNLQK